MTPPKWAQNLLLDAGLWLESQGESVPPVSLTWWHGKRHSSSSGRYRPDTREIHVTSGQSRLDCKLVLLHELAHACTPHKERKCTCAGQWYGPDSKPCPAPTFTKYECHTDEFWVLAWQLFRWAGLPIRYCREREYSYAKSRKTYAKK